MKRFMMGKDITKKAIPEDDMNLIADFVKEHPEFANDIEIIFREELQKEINLEFIEEIKRYEGKEKVKKWCNTHRRNAGHCLSQGGKRGGIALPCRIIDCEEVGIEIWDDKVEL